MRKFISMQLRHVADELIRKDESKDELQGPNREEVKSPSRMSM